MKEILRIIVWPLFALIAILLFRPQLAGLIDRSETLKVFGVEVKAKDTAIQQLADTIALYEKQKNALLIGLQKQEERTESFLEKIKNLEQEISACGGRAAYEQLSKDVQELNDANRTIKTQNDIFLMSEPIIQKLQIGQHKIETPITGG